MYVHTYVCKFNVHGYCHKFKYIRMYYVMQIFHGLVVSDGKKAVQ